MSESRGRPGLRGNVDECGCDWEMGGGARGRGGRRFL